MIVLIFPQWDTVAVLCLLLSHQHFILATISQRAISVSHCDTDKLLQGFKVPIVSLKTQEQCSHVILLGLDATYWIFHVSGQLMDIVGSSS